MNIYILRRYSMSRNGKNIEQKPLYFQSFSNADLERIVWVRKADTYSAKIEEMKTED